MIRALPITPELTRQYAGQNCWVTHSIERDACGANGPNGGQCTLRKGHSGFTHIAHNYSHRVAEDHDLIYAAWVDGDEDLEMDEGL